MTILSASSLSVGVQLPHGSFKVITNLSFELGKGKVLGLVGESGAGKSMLGRSIAQTLPKGFSVTGGQLLFGGKDLVAMGAGGRRKLLGRDIAFIPQEPLTALNPVLTIGQQMREHHARIGHAPRSQWRQDAIAALDSVHLTNPKQLLEKYPHQLSGGMCQRVLIAMAFASRPKLLIADEPTTALDVTIQARIVKLLQEMQERDGTSVVFITHDLRLAAQVCDEIVVLYAGRAIERGPARELFHSPAHPYTRTLLLANPPMRGERRGLYALPKQMPGLVALNTLRGCRFAPRCPAAVPACENGDPPLRAVGVGRVAACIRPEVVPGIRPPLATPVPERTDGTPILRMENVSKAFHGPRRFLSKGRINHAVRNASFTVGRNEFVGLVGESGSGKSTLARIAAGLEHASAGLVELFDRDVTRNDARDLALRRDKVQMIFQDPHSALNPRRRVGSIVTQVMEAIGHASGDERSKRAEALLAEVGMAPEMALRYPSQLSGGQKQRVNVARGLGAEPKLLVADEIVSGLDVSVQAQLLDLLIKIRRDRGLSMLFISHDLSVVRYLCDRVVVLYRGEVVETGATEQVLLNPTHPYTRLLVSSVPPDDPDEEWKQEDQLALVQ